MSTEELDTESEPSADNDLLFKQGEIEIREGDCIEHDRYGPLVATGTKTMNGGRDELLTIGLAEDNETHQMFVPSKLYFDGSRDAEESIVAAINQGIAEVEA